MKKGKHEVHPFCPKSTINLTYLCYGKVKYKLGFIVEKNYLDKVFDLSV